jgi:O-antigen ligase
MAILLLGGLVAAFGGEGAAAQAMGRNPNLTGRTEIWQALMPLVANPVLGTGFENFWFGPRVAQIWGAQNGITYGINEAHDGFLEVYLNLGLIGVSLIVAILLQAYRNAVQAFRRDAMFGNLMLAYILTAVIYSITEAGFRMLDPIWFLLLLSAFASEKVSAVAREINLPERADVTRATFQTSTLLRG